MAAYFPVMMGLQALNWLEALPADSINSWQDLCNAFVQHYQASCMGPKTRWDLASVKDVIHYFNEGFHNIELWRKMFETNPKTVGDMMTVVNTHADMEKAERAYHRHKNDYSERPPQRDNRSERYCDGRPPCHGKKHDRTESSKNRDCKHGPENTIAIAERSQFRSTLNQADLDRLLDGKCPWHKDANHTSQECRALSNGVNKDEDPKRPRCDDHNRPGGSRTTQARPRRRNSPRRDDDEQREDSPGNFQEEDRVVNYIYGKPSCWRKLKLDDREVNLVFKHPVEPLRWSEMPITFDRRDHWVHLPRPSAYPLVVSPVVSQICLAKVLIDGGSALDIIFASTLQSMGYDMTSLVPSDQDFYGIIPGAGSTPISRAILPVTFGTHDNYHTEYVNFEVAEFETSYHTILERPSLTKFMAFPNHTYLLLKMPSPKGVLSVYGDLQTSYACEAKNIELSDTLERSRNSVLVAQAAQSLPVDQQHIPAKESTFESQLAPVVATKTIVLRDDEPHKTAVIGASLDSA
ncbi:uncharacterized protein LOC120653453 [Panicum virgatum]|uniref:uncharacterized protein LOC120653453 n=1 Tax=Panicum virgatum TaxID=38727 RepID=UPI0019D5258E|nr:uncharacterized protein LOC120653453 [Panicum virgatum]